MFCVPSYAAWLNLSVLNLWLLNQGNKGENADCIVKLRAGRLIDQLYLSCNTFWKSYWQYVPGLDVCRMYHFLSTCFKLTQMIEQQPNAVNKLFLMWGQVVLFFLLLESSSFILAVLPVSRGFLGLEGTSR